MTKTERAQGYLTKEEKLAFDRWAVERGLNTSAAVRLLIIKALEASKN